jgi:hypothetical protein
MRMRMTAGVFSHLTPATNLMTMKIPQAVMAVSTQDIPIRAAIWARVKLSFILPA